MHISKSTLFLAGLSIIGLVSAAPAPSRTTEDKSLHPRACQTVFPTFITKIYEASPDQIGNANNSFFEVEYDFNGLPERKERDAVVQFEFIPPNAYGYSLEAFFPAGARVEGHGDNRVDVYAVDRSSPVSEFSWNQAPKTHLSVWQRQVLLPPRPGRPHRHQLHLLQGYFDVPLHYLEHGEFGRRLLLERPELWWAGA